MFRPELRLTDWFHCITQLAFEVIAPIKPLFQPPRVDAPFLPSLALGKTLDLRRMELVDTVLKVNIQKHN
jgi:P2-related tail formation protein